MNKPLPTDAAERKTYPMYSGLIKYFPKALAAVSHLSHKGNQQHHPDKPLHWDKNKSTDELDALTRHLVEGEFVHVAWRALANLERELDGGYKPFTEDGVSELKKAFDDAVKKANERRNTIVEQSDIC